MARKTTTVRLPEELAETAEVVARGGVWSVNGLVIEALIAEIARVKDRDLEFTWKSCVPSPNGTGRSSTAWLSEVPDARRSTDHRRSSYRNRCRRAGPGIAAGVALLALHAPQAGFGDEEFYPEFVDKAAVLAVRIARNHPLPDGNKRLAWQALTMFCALNDYSLRVPSRMRRVETMLAIAAGELDEAAVARRLGPHCGRRAS